MEGEDVRYSHMREALWKMRVQKGGRAVVQNGEGRVRSQAKREDIGWV